MSARLHKITFAADDINSVYPLEIVCPYTEEERADPNFPRPCLWGIEAQDCEDKDSCDKGFYSGNVGHVHRTDSCGFFMSDGGWTWSDEAQMKPLFTVDVEADWDDMDECHYVTPVTDQPAG